MKPNVRKMLKPLSRSEKSAITADWQSRFSQMDVLRPMWLARRVGPFVQGLILERKGGPRYYLPILHLHSLCRASDVVSLTLTQPLKSARARVDDPIWANFHAKRWSEAADRLEAASLLPLDDGFSAAQVLSAYKTYEGMEEADSAYPLGYYEDGARMLGWLGKVEEAVAYADVCATEMRAWPDYVIADIGTVDAWRAALVAEVQNPDALRALVEAQAEALGVQSLRVSRLFDD